MALFDRKYVYPCDHIGEYVEREGRIVEWEYHEGIGSKVTIQTKHGHRWTGWAEGGMASPSCWAKIARIRIYDAGGGFYPDNRVTYLGREVPA